VSLFKRTSKGADPSDDAPEAPIGGAGPAEADETFDRSGGPFDVGEVDGPQGRLDVGGLWLPMIEGMELQLQVDEASGAVTGAFVVMGESGVQLQAFAAPRSEGIWSSICQEIAAGITEQGGTADPGYGRFGRELLARVPAQQPNGQSGFQPLRFTGIDGPRWLLRAVFHGRSAIDPAAAADLERLVSQVVVVRGSDPMGPRELLPLRLPEGAQVSGGPPGADPTGGPGPHERLARDERPAKSLDDLHPFARGPEITERR
jgi:hypothetical protein